MRLLYYSKVSKTFIVVAAAVKNLHNDKNVIYHRLADVIK